MNKFSVILIESRFTTRTFFIDAINKQFKLVLIGTAISENKARQMLQSFHPNIVFCNIEFISRGFVRWLSPFFESKDINFIVYGHDEKQKKIMEIIHKFLKVNYADFIEIKDMESQEAFDCFCEEVVKRLTMHLIIPKDPDEADEMQIQQDSNLAKKVIAIGASAGGPRIIKSIINQLPKPVAAAVMIVQHLPESFSDSLISSIKADVHTALSVVEAKDMLPIEKGNVYIAPGGVHLEVEKYREGGMCRLMTTPHRWSVRPSIDHLMETLPSVFGKNIVGVILTGMGRDGTYGMQLIKKAGGYTIVQDEQTSLVFGMPKAAIEGGAADRVLPFTRIAMAAYRYVQIMDDKVTVK